MYPVILFFYFIFLRSSSFSIPPSIYSHTFFTLPPHLTNPNSSLHFSLFTHQRVILPTSLLSHPRLQPSPLSRSHFKLPPSPSPTNPSTHPQTGPYSCRRQPPTHQPSLPLSLPFHLFAKTSHIVFRTFTHFTTLLHAYLPYYPLTHTLLIPPSHSSLYAPTLSLSSPIRFLPPFTHPSLVPHLPSTPP